MNLEAEALVRATTAFKNIVFVFLA